MPEECRFEADERHLCGPMEITKENCEKKGCCFDPIRGVSHIHTGHIGHRYPTCYLPKGVSRPPTPKAKCSIARHRIDCGFPGVNEESCAAKGCCYDE